MTHEDGPADGLTPPLWAEQLHAQGQSIAWLARELDVSRTYLSAIASGKRHASAELTARIEALLNGALHVQGPERLDRVRTEAAARVLWGDVRDLARRLGDAIDAALNYRRDRDD